MVNTRSKAATAKGKPATVLPKGGRLDAPSTSHRADSNVINDEEPNLKRRRIVTEGVEAGSAALEDGALREPENGTLEALPLDIILEVLLYLHPLDILHLARTSKIFRKMLMSRNSSHIWRKARSSLGFDVPDCPPGQSEPQWVNLLFNIACSMCNSSDTTRVEWGLRIRGCDPCFEESLVLGSAAPQEFPDIPDIEKILDLLPFAYESRWSWRRTSPRATKRMHRKYYRPAIQPMIDRYQSYRRQVLAKTPNAKEVFLDFVTGCKQNVKAVFELKLVMEKWESRQLRLKQEERYNVVQRWRDIYRDKLVAIGYFHDDAQRASYLFRDNLEAGWESNRALLEKAALQAKCDRLFQQRAPAFRALCKLFFKETKKEAPIRKLWPTSIIILNATPELRNILQTGEDESYQDQLKILLPGSLDKWWEARKEILVDIVLRAGAQGPYQGASTTDPQNDEETITIPSFASAYIDTTGPSRLAILDLAKSIFECSCRTMGWLENCPIYWDRSLVNHHCIREKSIYGSGDVFDFPYLEFDGLASKQVDAVCAALDLDPDVVKFVELDELDARFRCVGCPHKKEIMNWRVAVKHRHNKGRSSQRFPPTFTKIPDDEAAIVRAYELENPDRSCLIGRIRSKLCHKAFHTTDELLEHYKNDHGRAELTSDSYQIDPCIPPKPVLEADAFEE